MAELVHIHYRRPPDREEVFRQYLVHDAEEVKVTFASDLSFDEPVTIDGGPVLENGSDAVWFTFPEAWHDIGRFYTADGVFQGLYANILTPPVFEEGGVWRTTDLFLDLWIPSGATEPTVLDRDQLLDALERGWIDEATADRARAEVERLLAAHRVGRWPPEVTRRWTRERARAAVG